MERMTYPRLQDPDLSSFASSNNVISEQWYSRYEIFPINQTEIGGGGDDLTKLVWQQYLRNKPSQV